MKKGHFYFDKFAFDRGNVTILEIYVPNYFICINWQDDFNHIYL